MKQTTYNVLIADDQPDNVFLLEVLLKKHPDLVIHSVPNGLEALQFVESNPVDIVLMDIMMPVMDGITATQKLREKHGPAELPIIMVTTLNDTDHIVQSFEAGANDYIPKPIEKNALNARIRSSLHIVEAMKNEIEMNHRLKQFSFAVAHDIRNPLAHMRVLCEAAREELISCNDLIPQIDELAEKAYIFMDGILQHSAYNKSEDIKNIQVGNLVEDVKKFLGANIESSHAIIETQDLPEIKASYSLVFQVILNLVGNSLKYKHQDRNPVIKIFSQPHSDFIQLSVQDNCRGIAPEDLEHVLQPLSRGPSSEGTSGSGLGLSLADNIMQDLGGKIDIESQEGVGTTIHLYFKK